MLSLLVVVVFLDVLVAAVVPAAFFGVLVALLLVVVLFGAEISPWCCTSESYHAFAMSAYPASFGWVSSAKLMSLFGTTGYISSQMTFWPPALAFSAAFFKPAFRVTIQASTLVLRLWMTLEATTSALGTCFLMLLRRVVYRAGAPAGSLPARLQSFVPR